MSRWIIEDDLLTCSWPQSYNRCLHSCPPPGLTGWMGHIWLWTGGSDCLQPISLQSQFYCHFSPFNLYLSTWIWLWHHQKTLLHSRCSDRPGHHTPALQHRKGWMVGILFPVYNSDCATTTHSWTAAPPRRPGPGRSPCTGQTPPWTSKHLPTFLFPHQWHPNWPNLFPD